ncbi:solute carrier family 12 member 1-like isoform X2 [Gordionus sp. m RMFG-2023]|uniref:solute carrier family 12 member 1-like isoform X2 n=1 Tax=Gordionus sp. m RMFG-2023 TaxID=3053472 RepID=UPI0031FBEA6F
MSSKDHVHHSASEANIKHIDCSLLNRDSLNNSQDKLTRTGSRFKVALVENNSVLNDHSIENAKYLSQSEIFNLSKKNFKRKKISCPISTGVNTTETSIYHMPHTSQLDDLPMTTKKKQHETKMYLGGSIEIPDIIDDHSSVHSSHSQSSSIIMADQDENIIEPYLETKLVSNNKSCFQKPYNYERHVKIESNKKDEELKSKEGLLSQNEKERINSNNTALSNDKTENGSTYYKKMMTYETLPNVEHYKNIFSMVKTKGRPSLTELHNRPRLPEQFIDNDKEQDFNEPQNGEYNEYRQQQEMPLHSLRTGIKRIGSDKERGISLGPKFGWIKGVLVRCMLNIWGVMLFLRLSWVVGQSGVGIIILFQNDLILLITQLFLRKSGLATMIVLLSITVTIITSMSMSAICTNGDVKGGGAYYMISRSLGPEFGGAIGIIFSLANAVAVSMYIVGFSETVLDLISKYVGSYFGISATNWIRIIGCLTAILLLAISLAGMEWEAKAQIGLLVLLLIAILNYIIGSFLPSKDLQKAKGFFGYNVQIFKQNFKPAFTKEENFFSVFSIFFPAATGILAGANISGDLKNAQKAIPKGTFLAILITTAVYLALIWMLGFSVIREASGKVSDLFSFNNLSSLFPGNVTSGLMLGANNTIKNFSNVLKSNDANANNLPLVSTNILTKNMSKLADYVLINGDGSHLSCATNQQLDTNNGFNINMTKCKYGLLNDYQVVDMISIYGPITTIGIFSATLSSALASLVGAPKVFQALCRDNLFPGIRYFAVGSKKNDEPYRAYVLAFAIAVLFILVAQLNLIAPIISNFFLMAYALINYSCFDASMSKSIGFRPSFKYFNKWISLFGSGLCLVTMFLIQWWAAFLTFFFVISFYGYVRYKKPDVNWGSSTQAHSYKNALTSVLKLNNIEEHVKNFRPQILALTGDPKSRPAFLDFVNNFTKNISLLICGHVILGQSTDMYFDVNPNRVYTYFKHRKIKSMYNAVVAPTLRMGVKSLIQLSGLGRLRPNVLMMGYKNNWESDDMEALNQYFNIIHDTFDMRFGLGILRLKNGLDYSFYTNQNTSAAANKSLNEQNNSRYKMSLRSSVTTNENYEMGSNGKRDPYGVSKHNYYAMNAQNQVSDDEYFDEEDDFLERGLSSKKNKSELFLDQYISKPFKRVWSGIGNGGCESEGKKNFVSHKDSVKSSSSNLFFRGRFRKNSLPSLKVTRNNKGQGYNGSCSKKNLAKSYNKLSPSISIHTPTKMKSMLFQYQEDAYRPQKRTIDASGKEAVIEAPMSPNLDSRAEQDATPNNISTLTRKKRTAMIYNKNILSSINLFHYKQKKGYIDVWWLFDDGGLTILLPYIISQRRNWENCKMRFFALSKDKKDLDIMHHNFGAMLTKFRIDYSDVIILPDIHHKPKKEGISDFESLISKYRVRDENDPKYKTGMITDAEYLALEQKTHRHIRLHEMLNLYSLHSNLIVMTLPMPRKGTCSSALYMGWLEIMTRNLPPILLLRGNQQSVLTFYS